MKKLLRTCLLALVVVGYALLLGCSEGGETPPARAPAKDVSAHPLYKNYSFGGPKDKVIDVGIQPLWFPTSAITETIRRDAILRQALAELGLKIRFHAFLKGADLNFFLGRGELEAGVAGDMPTLTAASTQDVVVPALIHQGFISILADQPMLLGELRGRPIGYAYGASAHYALLNALANEGLTEKDVKLSAMNITEMPQALQKGEIAAFTSWEPNTSIFLNTSEKMFVIHKSRFSGYIYFTTAFAKTYPEAMRHILAAQLRAMAWMGERKANLLKACGWAMSSTKQFTGKEPALSTEQLASLVKEDLLDVVPVPLIPEMALEPRGRLFLEFAFLKKLGKIQKKTAWDKVRSSFDRSILSQVLSNPKKYRLTEYEYQR